MSVRTAWAPRFALIVSLWAPAPLGLAQTAPTRLDTYESRLEMLALTQTLNAEILASSSATQSLEKWCRDHKMADDPIIVARVIAGIDKVPTVSNCSGVRSQRQRRQLPASRIAVWQPRIL